jgi:circadian clock protein KaiB
MSDESSEYVLRLYVAGTSPQSSRAISNIRKICEDYLKNRYELEVVDVYQDSASTEADQIIAVPTLVKRGPSPMKKIVGDFSNLQRVLAGLDIR